MADNTARVGHRDAAEAGDAVNVDAELREFCARSRRKLEHAHSGHRAQQQQQQRLPPSRLQRGLEAWTA